MNFTLKRKQAAVAAIDALLADDAIEAEQARRDVAVAQARLVAIEHRKAARYQERAKAEAALAAAEETALEQLNVERAGWIVRMQATDPVGNHDAIVAALEQLRRGVRSGLDTPANVRYAPHPLVVQAMQLMPPLDDLYRPVFEMGGAVAGVSDWASRRKAILAAAESNPPPQTA
jgi:hypothetical protein